MFTLIKHLYYWSTGYSYTHLGRLFLRLFAGVMLLQFGVRQWINFEACSLEFPSILGLAPEVGLTILVFIEIFCSFFIMCGFLTRLMTCPPLVAMIIAEYYLLNMSAPTAPYELTWQNPAYLPMMFIGIYFFILLVGPGKISVDYFLSLHFIHSDDGEESDELEEV